MSMISEQVKGLRKLGNQWKHNDVAGGNLIFEAADTIETLSAKLARYSLGYGEWIPCSERLPSESGNYLITVADLRLGHIGEHTVTMADFYAKAKKWNSIVDVYAWMPLPEPWKDGEE